MPEWIIKYWLEWLFAAVTAGLTYALKRIWGRQKEQTARQKAIEDGLRGLLHDRILQSYISCDKKGYADVDDLENLGYLYQSYHALDGNGTGTELFDRVKKMPVKPVERG